METRLSEVERIQRTNKNESNEPTVLATEEDNRQPMIDIRLGPPNVPDIGA